MLIMFLLVILKENRARAERKRTARNPDENTDEENSGKTCHGDNEGGFVKSNDPYFYVRKSGDFAGNGHVTGTGQQRPVTVRSVKRRDKAKTEEKNNRFNFFNS
jgi:hypothetical protein